MPEEEEPVLFSGLAEARERDAQIQMQKRHRVMVELAWLAIAIGFSVLGALVARSHHNDGSGKTWLVVFLVIAFGCLFKATKAGQSP